MSRKIFFMMGKSSSGKDTLYHALMHSDRLSFNKVIPYTTRPIRSGEQNGEEYFFCTEDDVERYQNENKIIEIREYEVVCGIWKYFTVEDGQIDLQGDKNYLMIGTLASYDSIRSVYGAQNVIPLYIEVEDGERLSRAVEREKMQAVPRYDEVCRRFLADATDFSEEKLEKAGIRTRFYNETLEQTIHDLEEYILQCTKAE